MANNLDLSATLKLIDDISAPLRGIESQVSRSVNAFNDARDAVKKLEATQNRITAFKDMSRELTETSGKLQAAKQRMEALRQQIAATNNPSQTLINRFNTAQRSVERLDRSVDGQRQSLAQLRQRLESAGVSTSNLGRDQSRLADQIAEANRRLDQQRQRMDGVRRAQQQSQQMGDMRNKSIQLAAGGAAATYGAARLLAPGIELEAKLSKVEAITRLDKNSPEYKALAEQAKKLGATTSFTASDAASGQAFLAMAGFTPKAIKAAMPGMLDLALAGEMDLPQTADIASNILSGMKLDPTKDMGKVGDVLSAAFTRANLDVAMLGETMKYAAPGASALGVSLEQLAGMSGKLGDSGIQASEAGTALRAIMQRLASLPKPVSDAMKELGVQSQDANGNLRSMPDILKDIYDKTKNLGTAEQATFLSDISGLNASGAMTKLVEYAGSGELQTLIQDLEGSNGELSKLAKTMSDNTSGDWAGTTSAIDAFRTALFDANRDGIREFLQSITTMTQKMTEWANTNPELMATLGKTFAILAIGAVVIGSFGAILLTILGPMALLRASFATLGGFAGIFSSLLAPLKMLWSLFGFVGQAVVSAVALIGKSLMFLLNIIRVVGMAMMANPILIAITLLAVAAYLVYRNWGPIKEFFINLWAAITASVSAAWEWIKSIFNAGIQALNSFLSSFNPVSFFMTAFTAVWTYLSGLSATFYSYGANLLQGLKNGIMSRATAVVEGIKGVAGRIKGAFTGLMGIHSPSRVFAGYGDFMMQGLNNGLLKNNSPVQAMLKTSDSLRDAMDTSEIRFDNRKPISASAMMGGNANQSQSTAPITIIVNAQPHQSEQQIAELVAATLAKQQRNQSNNNTALYDLAEQW